MVHSRTKLNGLIFHNQIVLPRTSPGFGEVSLAVAELQGGNTIKAAAFAEAAVGKDPTLAAGWLAKMVADVFEATPDDLRKERAVFCMDRALEYAPSCHTEIIEFFVTNILGHYVDVFCQGAAEDVDEWLNLETRATALELQAMQLESQAAHWQGKAGLLEATGLVTALVALFSRRLGTRVFSGVASVVAFSEAVRVKRDAALLDTMSNDLWTAGNNLRLEGGQHRMASMLHFLPARDLIALGAQLLQAGGLSERTLTPAIGAFRTAFEHVLGIHLGWLQRELSLPIKGAIDGKTDSLRASYFHQPGMSPLLTHWKSKGTPPATPEPSNFEHPASRATALWLSHMLPGATKLEAYQLLASPLATISKSIRPNKDTLAGCCIILLILFLIGAAHGTAVYLLPALLWTWGIYKFFKADAARTREHDHLHEVAHSIWSVGTWLKPGGSLDGRTGTELPQANTATPSGGTTGADRITGATKALAFTATVIGILFWYGQCHQDSSPATKPSDAASRTTPTVRNDAPARETATVPRAIAVPSTANRPNPPEDPATTDQSYAVTGVGDGDTLSVHARPSMKSGVSMRLLARATGLLVIGPPVMNDTTEWVQIKFEGRTGWVAKRYLKPERR